MIKSMRPHQWIKNIFVFAAILLTGQFFNVGAWLLSTVAFVSFSIVSSAGYLINDVRDREKDKVHPTKRYRPIAMGTVSVPSAMLASIVLGVLGLTLAYVTSPQLAWVLVGYAVLTVTYSFYLKNIIILDIIVVALGFVLRVLGGGLAIGVMSTHWSLVCVFFLALLISTGKRLAEYETVGAEHRTSLQFYTYTSLHDFLNMSAQLTVLTYALFTITSGKSDTLYVTYLLLLTV